MRLLKILAGAAVLAGDILELRQRSTPDPAGSPVLDTRDRIEDVVNGHGRFWNPRASYGLAHWTALLAGGALLIPAARLPGGLPAAGLAATVAVIVTMTAVLAGRRSEKVCAAVGVAIGCGWAAFVGWQLCQGWLLTGAAGLTGPAVLPVTLAVASGCALLLAGGAAVTYPAALVHACALLVVGVGCAVVTLAARMGGSFNETACVAALSAVLVIGGLPRVALAIGGLSGEARSSAADLDARITRADRVLLGCLIGVGMVAAGGAIPAALIGDGWLRLLATGIGLLLLLRSRAFSRTPQVLAARIAGMLVIGCLWVGVYRGDPQLQAVLILGAALSTAALTIGAAVTSPAGSPVGRARAGRTLDLAEQLLVVALIVLAAGVSGLFDWVSSVIG